VARIVHRCRWRGRKTDELPGFEQPGLLLFLDPEEVPEDPRLTGKPIQVVPPDGPPFEVVVTASAKLDCVGLLFAWAPPGLIPPGSEVRW
jgi:hypothetical protein